MNRARVDQQREWLRQRVNSGGRSFSPWDALELYDALLSEDQVEPEPMTDYAKEPQPEAPRCETCGLSHTGDVLCVEARAEARTPRIALMDGDTTTPLSAEALVVALFMCGFVLVRDPAGKLLDVGLDRNQVIALALKAQGAIDAGEPIKLETHRVMRPTNGGGLVGA